MASDRRNPAFAAVIERLTAGRSNREIWRLTGVSHTYVGDMRWGIVPSFRILERFCEGLGLSEQDAREVFAAAGYEPIRPDADDALRSLLETAEKAPQELTYEPDLEDVTVEGFHGAENLSRHDLEVVNRIVRALLAEKRKRRGVE